MEINYNNLNLKEILSRITTLVFDIDGVLSANNVSLDSDGELIRTANVKDGFVLKYALEKGLNVFIITGCINMPVETRLRKLGIEEIIVGSRDKLADFEKLVNKYKLNYSEILYMGDDVPDLCVMKKVALPCCPADACEDVKEISLYISDKKGGDACVRDIVEQIMRVKRLWIEDGDKYI